MSDSLPWNWLPVPSKQRTIRRGPESSPEEGLPSSVACGILCEDKLEGERNNICKVMNSGDSEKDQGFVGGKKQNATPLVYMENSAQFFCHPTALMPSTTDLHALACKSGCLS